MGSNGDGNNNGWLELRIYVKHKGEIPNPVQLCQALASFGFYMFDTPYFGPIKDNGDYARRN